MTNQDKQQTKLDAKNTAIISLILGIISVIPIIQFLSSENPSAFRAFHSLKTVLFLSAFSILGMILGIKGLNSSKKKLAIGGIIFSIVGVLGLIFFLYMWLIVSIGAI